jgi:hypothetical protein
MKNVDAIARFDDLYIRGLRHELEPHLEPEYQNLKTLLEAGLRSCVGCGKSTYQGEMIETSGDWVHVDCAYENHLDSQLDPTTRGLKETDDEYAERMRVLDRYLKGY